jgi:Gas vesicle protein
MRTPARRRRGSEAALRGDGSLLELVDHLLAKGVVVNGEVMLGLADVDLIYLRLSALLCAADRVLAPEGARAPRGRPRRR